MFTFEEHIYESNLSVKYVFEPGNENYLVVAFSAFSPLNAENQKAYHHMRTLADIDCNKLFILDAYGPRGCYYIGEKLNFEFETSVQSLITYIARKCSVNPEKIICVGSSKGGSAALYYGLKYNYGHIISGAPQIKIADYVKQRCAATAEYMIGNAPENTLTEKLNNVIFKQLNKELVTNVHLFTSEHDEQFNDHIKPLLDIIKERNIPCNITINNDMKNHADVARFYPSYMRDLIQKTIYKIDDISADISSDKNTITISVDLKLSQTASYKKVEYLYTFKAGGNIVNYTSNLPLYTFVPEQIGCYNSTVSVLLDGKKTYSINLGEKIIDKNKFTLNGYSLTEKNGNLVFTLDINETETLRYAYYIYKDKVSIFKGGYSHNKKIVFPLQGSGNYMITYFIKSKKDEIVMCTTDILTIA